METTETQQPPYANDDIILSQEAQYYLQQSGKWATFLAIIGFIFCGFLLLGVITMGMAGSLLSQSPQFQAMPPYVGAIMPYLAVIYLIIAIIFFLFNLYLIQFGTKIKQGIAFADHVKVTEAMRKLKSFFKLWGIITIVIIAFYVLCLVAVIIGGVGAATMLQGR